MSAITIPTNATAPAAPPTIAARDPDIGYGNQLHFVLQFEIQRIAESQKERTCIEYETDAKDLTEVQDTCSE